MGRKCAKRADRFPWRGFLQSCDPAPTRPPLWLATASKACLSDLRR